MRNICITEATNLKKKIVVAKKASDDNAAFLKNLKSIFINIVEKVFADGNLKSTADPTVSYISKTDLVEQFVQFVQL